MITKISKKKKVAQEKDSNKLLIKFASKSNAEVAATVRTATC